MRLGNRVRFRVFSPTVGGVRIPHAVCVRHLRYVYTHLRHSREWTNKDGLTRLRRLETVCVRSPHVQTECLHDATVCLHIETVCVHKSATTRARPRVYTTFLGGGPRVVVSTAAFHARVRGSVPGLFLKETKMFLPHPRVKVSIVGSLRDREVACSASDRQGSNFESCVWRTVSSQSSHHPQEVLLAQFSLYVHKGGLKPDSFHFIFYTTF